ncbi:uncharacterized protein LOC141855821 [Brevipalpus obovatus]|uniref:uncharacterized protein LOC141855821 n=1 Tax=Brevipalpus obovatus TaxID=246614 RepID=UPI003D9EF3D4
MYHKRKFCCLDGLDDLKLSSKRKVTGRNRGELCSIDIINGGHKVSERAIHIALRQPLIIRRIFSFLGAHEIHQCGKVCSGWRREAIPLLTKYPLKDDYKLMAKSFTSEVEALRKEKKHDILEILANKNLNVDEDTCPFVLEYCPSCYWWFFWRGDNLQHPLGQADIDRTIKSFFESDMGCVPSFSYMYLDESFKHVAISAKCPTIMLYQPKWLVPEEFRKDILCKLNEIIRQPHHFKDHSRWVTLKFSEAFHINRYTSDLRVIITDWSNLGSKKPNLEDTQYPIKSLIFLSEVGYYRYMSAWAKFIKKVQKKRPSANISGGMMGDRVRILYCAPDFCRFRCTKALSIAFVGKQVQSSTFEILFTKERPRRVKILEKVSDFREHLDFPTEDGRVFGFIFEICNMIDQHFTSIVDQIDAELPGIPLYRIRLSQYVQGDDYVFGGFSAVQIHLLRF